MKDMERQVRFRRAQPFFRTHAATVVLLRGLHRIVKAGPVRLDQEFQSLLLSRGRTTASTGLGLTPRGICFCIPWRVCETLAEEAGFEIKDIVFESSEFQFWGASNIFAMCLLWTANPIMSIKKNPFSEEKT